MATATKATVVICIQSFVGGLDGVEVQVHEGDILPADSPIVKRWAAFFTEPANRIEQATAAPGEKRG